MPEIISYGTSIYSGTGFATNTNLLGAPNGTTGSSNTSGQSVRIRLAGFSAFADTSRIDQVFVGIRLRGANTNAGVTLTLETVNGAVDDASRSVAPSSAQVDIDTDFEVELTASLFSPAGVKHPDFRVLLRKTTSTGIAYVDAVWLRVVYSDRPDDTAITKHAASVFSSAWGNPTGALGAPDESYSSTTTVGATASLNMGGLTTLPDGAMIHELRAGAKYNAAAANGAFTMTVTPVSSPPALVPSPVPSLSISRGVEFVLDPAIYTVAVLKDPALRINVVKSGSGSVALDAVWIRAVYGPPVATSRAKRWTGTEWQPAPLQRWDGTQFVTATVKRFDGSGWV